MKGLDYKHFKKIASDKNTTTLKHKDGHELRIAHYKLSDEHRGALERLPMAKGGEVRRYAEGERVEKPKEFEPGRDYSKESLPGDQNSELVPKLEPQPEVPATVDVGMGSVPNPASTPSNIAQVAPGSIGEPTPPSTPQAPQPTAPEAISAPAQAQSVTSLAPSQAPAPAIPQAEEKAAAEDFRAESTAKTPDDARLDAAGFMDNERKEFRQALSLGHIQPKTYRDYFNDQSTLGKIGAVFGMFLGGVGGGLTGHPNAYMEAMDKLIQRDLDAQEKSNVNAHNWYQARIRNMEALNGGRKLTLEEKAQARTMAEADGIDAAMHHLVLKSRGNPSDPEVAKANAALAVMFPIANQKIKNSADIAASAIAYAKSNPLQNLTGAQKEADQQYAKDYVEWTTKGRSASEKGLHGLEEAKKALQNDSSISGGFTGVAEDVLGKRGERLTSNKVLQQRQLILQSALPLLKATFTGSISDDERRALLQSYYNEKAGAKTNIAGLNRLINDAKVAITRNNELATQYQKSGSISGYKPELKAPTADSESVETVKRFDSKSGKTVVFDAKTKKPLRFE